ADDRLAYTLSLHDALPISEGLAVLGRYVACDEVLKADRFAQHTAHLSDNQRVEARPLIEATRNQLAEGLREAILVAYGVKPGPRSEEHTSELQSRENLVCR